MNQVLSEYRPLKSCEALLNRSSKRKREFLYKDLLHQNIGNIEFKCFDDIFSCVHSLYKA